MVSTTLSITCGWKLCYWDMCCPWFLNGWMYFMPFLFMGILKNDLCFPWLGPVVCQSSCPFQRCECRLPSNGSWSTPTSLLWWVKPDLSTDRCRLLLPPSFRLTQPVLLLDLTQTSYLAGSCGLHSSSNRTLLLSLCLSFISLCPLHIYFPSPNSPSCACCSAFIHQPQNRKAHPQWICWHSARQSVFSGEGSNMVVVFKPTRGGFWSLWNYRRKLLWSFWSSYYTQSKWIQLKSWFVLFLVI